ncbi:hypothetical protein [Enterococcus mundtii]|uniref:hypothetical protein n=1 Tax=Enterococcus mundtii TaxID=53346 RepID=UPI0039708EA2
MDLFTPIVEEAKLHHNFVHLKKNKYLRRVLNEWAKGFQDRDGKFVKEFQTTFNSSFWELYLNAVLQEKFLNIDFSREAPDFIVVDRDKKTKYTIEATIANNAVNRPPEWDQEEKLKFMKKELSEVEIKNISLDATVRICNSILSKHKRYKNRYENLSHVTGKPFILALASYDSFYFYKYSMAPIIRALYGTDKLFYDDNGEVVEEIVEKVKKENGAEIEVGLFTNPKYKEISAILYSNTATYGKLEGMSCTTNRKKLIFRTVKYNSYGMKPIENIENGKNYKETISDGLYLFLNPFASIPLSQEDIKELTDNKTSTYYDKEYNTTEDGFLFSRETIRFANKIY